MLVTQLVTQYDDGKANIGLEPLKSPQSYSLNQMRTISVQTLEENLKSWDYEIFQRPKKLNTSSTHTVKNFAGWRVRHILYKALD